ncbi:LamG domain-containing protein [Candidatus Poribacteria bacterium]|jgi:hypothetical protein|nr:LamG domain-containing protein [Candidatus Poribacteria bacterium]MBT5533027.1 LamG domain-containing protein [Candidatus Poribacteria bacterium]MBT5711797.1 LamG domain-containing protein [Candidatus Poribacteria bacterium]MBT7097228.1 LamG domain-containing protein [Candidatus Poribacteria bacterium]MBT7808083.1 LamG domain-containing protein [Candidatus Poribacteria bacterium]
MRTREVAAIAGAMLLAWTTAHAGLVGHWPLDDSGLEAEDITGNGHTGTLQGGVEWVSGQFGGAALFDGTGQIQVASTPMLEVEELTGTMWISFFDVDPPRQDFFSKNDRFALSLHEAGNDFKVYPIVKVGADWFVAPGNVVIEPDVWHHVAMVYDGDGSTTYLDGVLDAETPGGGTLDWVGGLLTFGTFEARYLKGSMDEIKYYDTALTEGEVIEDMNAGLAVEAEHKATMTWASLKAR